MPQKHVVAPLNCLDSSPAVSRCCETAMDSWLPEPVVDETMQDINVLRYELLLMQRVANEAALQIGRENSRSRLLFRLVGHNISRPNIFYVRSRCRFRAARESTA